MDSFPIRSLSFLIAFCFASFSGFAQVEGLWLVESVSMGEQSMTPVAKWTRINPDQSYQSGNGWLQNSAGTWAFDKSRSTFLPIASVGQEDPFGPFSVNFQAGKMVWVRMEEEAEVKVVWKPIDVLPKAPADKLIGLWKVENGNDDETLFLRWDKIYVRTVNGQRSTGYWFMNAHRPELELIPHGEYSASRKWMVSFEGEEMRWKGNGPENDEVESSFSRLRAFP